MGAALYHLGRPQEALQSFERALALDPDRVVARTAVRRAQASSAAVAIYDFSPRPPTKRADVTTSAERRAEAGKWSILP